jgi:hypothetical protein
VVQPGRRTAGGAGWLTEGAANTIAILLTAQLERDVSGSLVEIGTYKGKTFAGLVLAARPDEMVIGFDLFLDEVGGEFRQVVERIKREGQDIRAIKTDTSRCRSSSI